MAAFSATAGKYSSPAFRTHALAKPVVSFSLEIRRLSIRHGHDRKPLSSKNLKNDCKFRCFACQIRFYDQERDLMTQKSFRPWVGAHYDETRLLLLGESAYSWGRRKDQRPTPDLPTIMVKEVLDDFGNANDRSFMKILSQGLAGEKEPSKELLHHVWNRVALTNYVGGTVGEGPRKRPTSDMWKAAKDVFRPDILNKLRPRRIIVIGKTMWSKMPDTNVYMTEDVQGYLLEDGSVVVCWALPHTAAGLSWTRLADTIYFALGRELPRSGRCPVDGE